MSHLQESLRDWAWTVGQGTPDRQWLLTGTRKWELNPHYRGPDEMQDFGDDENE